VGGDIKLGVVLEVGPYRFGGLAIYSATGFEVIGDSLLIKTGASGIALNVRVDGQEIKPSLSGKLIKTPYGDLSVVVNDTGLTVKFQGGKFLKPFVEVRNARVSVEAFNKAAGNTFLFMTPYKNDNNLFKCDVCNALGSGYSDLMGDN